MPRVHIRSARRTRACRALFSALVCLRLALTLFAQQPEPRALILPEQRNFAIRAPEQLRRADLPPVPAPPTVADPLPVDATLPLTLDESIRIALANSDVVRILAGDVAVAAGPTIYDPGISNTQVDTQRGVFDPVLGNTTTFSQTDQPFGAFNAAPPTTIIQGNQNQGFNSTSTLGKRFLTGGTAQLSQNVNRNDVRNGIPQALNPATGNSTEIGLTQPLLQGAGFRANTAPIVIARINTERSFFQLKDSVQDLVRSVVESYWNLQFAQIQVWVREQQVQQGKEALDRAEGRFAAGLGNLESDVAQARVSYENFRADLIGAQADVWRQEGVLRNLLGVSPSDGRRIVPATPLSTQRLPTDWDVLRSLAEVYRPDLIELKLILEADEQNLIIRRNQAQPQLDAIGLYRWNGLEGRTPDGNTLTANSADYQEWQTGVNFSVPLGLRTGRANVRQIELLLARDRANLDQGLHQATHELAAVYRDLAQAYEQFLAYRRVREEAYKNVQQQLAAFKANTRVLYLNVLLSINDWGNSVRNENQALASYNTLLARMEVRTGTILDSHGVRFAEERFGSIGPKGRLFKPVAYPRSMSPTPNVERPPPTPENSYKLPEFIALPGVDEPLGPRNPNNPLEDRETLPPPR